MWFIDFPTLLLLILAGLDVGVLGLAGYDAASALFGSYSHAAYVVVGFSALWQLSRQRFF